jgi:monoamine oxidase
VEPYSGGCPCHNATTGSMKDFVDGLRKPYKNIHFAGTETASQWMGYMDGAVDAGRRAASEILVSLREDRQLQDNEIDPYTFESQSRLFHLNIDK